MSSAVAIHGAIVRRKAGRVYLVQEEEPARVQPLSPEDRVIRAAAPLLMLASYRNQLVHVFVRPAMLATGIHITKSTHRGESWTHVFLDGLKGMNRRPGFFTPIRCSVHRRALHLLLLPTGCPLQRVHLCAREVVSGNHLVFQGSAASRCLRTKIIKAINTLQEENIDKRDKRRQSVGCRRACVRGFI